jgi:hypothetical protein
LQGGAHVEAEREHQTATHHMTGRDLEGGMVGGDGGGEGVLLAVRMGGVALTGACDGCRRIQHGHL